MTSKDDLEIIDQRFSEFQGHIDFQILVDLMQNQNQEELKKLTEQHTKLKSEILNGSRTKRRVQKMLGSDNSKVHFAYAQIVHLRTRRYRKDQRLIQKLRRKPRPVSYCLCNAFSACTLFPHDHSHGYIGLNSAMKSKAFRSYAFFLSRVNNKDFNLQKFFPIYYIFKHLTPITYNPISKIISP